jgi:glycosyltransferase involved in cell wall biosynthesis
MKIIFVIDSLANSGTERSLLDIISNFSQNTQVILIYLQAPHTLKSDYNKAGIQTVWLNENRNINFINNVFLLKSIIKKEQPNLIVSSLYKSNILSRFTCLFTNTKLIGTFVSDSYSKLRSTDYSLKQKIGFFIIKQFDKITATIPIAYISNSNSIKISNCKHLQIPKNKVKVIYRGRDTIKIVEWERPINNSKFVFIITARVLKTKGYKELIEAFSIVKKTNENIVLEIYGDGNYFENLKQLATKLGVNNSIYFKGNQLNGWQHLYQANCFIFPSWYEGLSGALIEASISGIPIIASNIAMNLEVVKCSKNAVLHNVRDVDSIVECMNKIITDYPAFVLQKTISRDAAINKFDIKKIAVKYEDFFTALNTKNQ